MNEGYRTEIRNLKTNNLNENVEIQEFKEIKDDAMNGVEKHIHNLSLTFNNNKGMTLYGNNRKLTNKTKINKNIRENNNDLNNINNQDEIILKRPYTAHGYKVKSKTKRLPKTVRNKNTNEEEKLTLEYQKE